MSKQVSQEMTIFGHLAELRKVLIVCIAAIVVPAVLVYLSSLDLLLGILALPLEKLGLQPVIIGVTEGFVVHIKVALFAGFFLATPVVLWQVLRFVFPILCHAYPAFLWPGL